MGGAGVDMRIRGRLGRAIFLDVMQVRHQLMQLRRRHDHRRRRRLEGAGHLDRLVGLGHDLRRAALGGNDNLTDTAIVIAQQSDGVLAAFRRRRTGYGGATNTDGHDRRFD